MDVKTDSHFIARRLTITAAITTTSLGLSVIIGWHAHIEYLIRYYVDTVAMVYNSALCLLLLSMSIIFKVYNFDRMAYACCWIVLFLVSIVLLQSIIGVDIGIDQIFFKHYDSLHNLAPGRMALSSAINFVCLSLALLLIFNKSYQKYSIILGGWLGFLILSSSIIYIGSYITGSYASYSYGRLTPMAFNTAIGFFILSGETILLSYYIGKLNGIQMDKFYPAILWSCIFVGASLLAGEITELQKMNNYYSYIPVVTFFIGNILAILSGALLFYAQKNRKLVQELLYQATHDSITKLPNQRALFDLTSIAIESSKWNKKVIGILLINIDRFTNLKDLFGRSKSDELLRLISIRLKKQLSDEYILGRIGDDEFLVLINNLINVEQVIPIINGLIRSLDKPIKLDGHELKMSICIGVAFYPNNGNNFDSLLGNADVAMLKAKQNGRNQFQFYTHGMHIYTIKHVELENQMHEAIAAQQFELYYQPIFDLAQKKPIGVEALIRWNHPDRGLIFPVEFIGIAEKIGLIQTIGDWVILTACKQIKNWNISWFDNLKVAFNVSSHQFRHNTLCETMENAIAETGVNPQNVEIELTESILIDSTKEVMEALQQLKRMGVSLSIDDFGTGYSSLSYLQKFPINKLKIDQSFVANLLVSERSKELVRAIIAMAKGLNLIVLAEGVETVEQLNFLEELGCDEIQGYYFAHPMPAEKCTRFLKGYL